LINVGIIGSCVSRDNFNSMFNAGYTRLFYCTLNINHITFASILSGKIDFNEEDIDLENSRDVECVKMELSRSYMQEIYGTADLDYLIIDFYSDVFYGIVIANDIIFTDDYRRVAKTKFYSQLENKRFVNIENNPDEYFEIWKKSFNKFIEIINTFMPNVKIIINKARAVAEYKDEHANIIKIPMARSINKINEMWDKFDDYAIKTYGFQYMDLSDKDYISYLEHPWGGPHPVHYTKEFYENFIVELSSIVVKDEHEKLYQLQNQDAPNINLIDNSNFEMGTDHWSFWQNNFNITDNKVEINNNGLEQDKYNLILSNPIKAKKGEFLKLSFKVYVGSDVEFDSTKIIFYLRLFKHPTKIFQKDSEWHKNLQYFNYSNDDVRNEWKTVNYVFKAPNNGFLKVGPGIAKNGHVMWKDIYLTDDVSNNSSWNPSYKDIMSKNRNFKCIRESNIKPNGSELSNINRNIKEKLEKEQQLNNQIHDLSLNLQNLTLTINESHKQRNKEENLLKNKIDKYENSNSWAITSPLRKMSNKFKNLRKK
jgi:hypothetical protein